jgi:hypothetical protein
MKIILDVDIENPNNVICKVGSRIYGEDMSSYKQNQVNDILRKFLINHTQLNDYEEDCMWMSYRYCIGRHTIASSMHAGDIWYNCKNRMSKERQLFTAFDINREIESLMTFVKPYFHFPLTSLNRIYTSAIDIFCQFLEDYNIKDIADLIKYRDIHIKLSDNERGYTFETVTWEEWLRPQVLEIVSKYYGNDTMSDDYAWKYFEHWKSGAEMHQEELVKEFERITRDMPNKDRYYMHDIEDLFVWNDLVHCFDYEHHHKSILTDGSECEWFWSWTNKTEQHEDGNYYRTFGYKKIRVPIDKWTSNITTYIPDESIKEDIY